MSLILKFFQKKDLLTIQNKQYQQTISSLFAWLVDNDKVTDDRTTKYFPNISSKAKIIAKENGIAAGIEEIEYLLKKYSTLILKPRIKDELSFKKSQIIAEISGKSHEILAYERTILNILQRLSGIATETSSIISLISPTSQIHIAATRKTPWMMLDKKAVAVGGGLTHRLNLSDGILIKDNHLSNISVAQALKVILNKVKGELIEIEVETEKQAHEAIKTFQKLKAHNHLAILLDNFTPSQAKSLLRNLSNLYDLSEIIFEASGGVDENNIFEWSKTGIDIVSLGSLTHSARAVDFSLEFS